MKKILSTLLVVPFILAFKSQFKYGCGSTTCTFQFVIPEEIARFVDPTVLVGQLTNLNYSIGVLQNLEQSMSQYEDTGDFNKIFEVDYSNTDALVGDVAGDVSAQNVTFSSAMASSAALLQQAKLLTSKTNCFQAGNISEFCGSLSQ